MTQIAIDQIGPKQGQPRQIFDQVMLQELANSITEIGLQQPIMVRPRNGSYEIIHGERRWRACRLAGLESIEAQVVDMDDNTAYTVSVVENEQREDLSPMETAEAIKHMMDSQQLTQSGIGKRIGRSRTWVTQKLRLLGLPSAVRESVRAGALSESHARQLLKLKDTDCIDALAEQAVTGRWSVSRLESEVNLALVGDNPELAKAQHLEATGNGLFGDLAANPFCPEALREVLLSLAAVTWAEFTATGMTVTGEPTFEEWRDVGVKLAALNGMILSQREKWWFKET